MRDNTVFVVTSTTKEHSDYQKRQTHKKVMGGLWAILVGLIGFGYLFYEAWSYIHVH